jgi:hypothetical protein
MNRQPFSCEFYFLVAQVRERRHLLLCGNRRAAVMVNTTKATKLLRRWLRGCRKARARFIFWEGCCLVLRRMSTGQRNVEAMTNHGTPVLSGGGAEAAVTASQ